MKRNAVPTKWHKLDNNANLFPVIANKRVTNVFRLTAVLTRPVQPALLQSALEQTLPYFPAFDVRLRHGLFWSYLETNRAVPRVRPEEDSPCRYIDPVQNERYLFRILYHGCRVHLETFHALTDGTGALRFLKAVCYRYCMLADPDAFTPAQRATPFGTEHAADVEDGYLKNYVPGKAKPYREPPALHMRGENLPPDTLSVVTALCPAAALREAARAHGVPVGEYLTAAIVYGVYAGYTRGRGAKRPISVFVPVNLRRFFASDTSTNFFACIAVALTLDGPGATFAEVLAQVHAQFAAQCNRDALAEKLAYTARSENNIFARIIPLPLKNGVLRVVYERSNNGSTLAFSNLGQTGVEPGFEPYFEGFRFLLSPTPKEPNKVTAIACKGEVAVTFTCALEQDVLARSVVRSLTAAGVPVTLEANGAAVAAALEPHMGFESQRAGTEKQGPAAGAAAEIAAAKAERRAAQRAEKAARRAARAKRRAAAKQKKASLRALPKAERREARREAQEAARTARAEEKKARNAAGAKNGTQSAAAAEQTVTAEKLSPPAQTLSAQPAATAGADSAGLSPAAAAAADSAAPMIFRACRACGVRMAASSACVCPLCAGPLVPCTGEETAAPDSAAGAQPDVLSQPAPGAQTDETGAAGTSAGRCAAPVQHAPAALADAYPVPQVRRYSFAKRLLAFLSVAAVGVCACVNLLTDPAFWWWLVAATAIGYAWAAVLHSMRRGGNGGGRILMQVVCGAAVCLLLDLETGWKGWAAAFALPVIFCAGIVSIDVLILCRRTSWAEYVIYQVALAALGFLPLVLYLAGIGHALWAAVLPAMAAGISLLALALFGDRTIKNEFRRRLRF